MGGQSSKPKSSPKSSPRRVSPRGSPRRRSPGTARRMRLHDAFTGPPRPQVRNRAELRRQQQRAAQRTGAILNMRDFSRTLETRRRPRSPQRPPPRSAPRSRRRSPPRSRRRSPNPRYPPRPPPRSPSRSPSRSRRTEQLTDTLMLLRALPPGTPSAGDPSSSIKLSRGAAADTAHRYAGQRLKAVRGVTRPLFRRTYTAGGRKRKRHHRRTRRKRRRR